MATPVNYSELIQKKGYAYKTVESYSHYNDPIDRADDRAAGTSRIWGDASEAVQKRAIDALIKASQQAGLDTRQTAHVLAIARVESGFNPDAAAGTTSAHGLGQFINKTGAHYGIVLNKGGLFLFFLAYLLYVLLEVIYRNKGCSLVRT